MLLARAGVRTRVGWVGWVRPGFSSRTRPPARRFWFLAPRFGASRPLRMTAAGFESALSAFARTRALRRDGRGRRQDAGRRAHDRAGDREAENPETPPCEDGLSAASTESRSRDPRPPASDAADLLDGRARFAQSRCRPAFERLRKRPSRTGREQTRTRFRACQGLFSRLPANRDGRVRPGHDRVEERELEAAPLSSPPSSPTAPRGARRGRSPSGNRRISPGS